MASGAGTLGASIVSPFTQFATAMHISTRPLAATAAQPDHCDLIKLINMTETSPASPL